jgi:hypothetical protein
VSVKVFEGRYATRPHENHSLLDDERQLEQD